MTKIRNLLILLGVLLSPISCANAPAGSAGGLSYVSIGVNIPAYPYLVAVPGYPVYYASQLEENFFFYDGLYWVYHDDNWYLSSWYNGPWVFVHPEAVPLVILQLPVRYYRHPPAYFHGWKLDAPPRWGEHWGRNWEQHRSGWDRADRKIAPKPAPLPAYQQKYPKSQYPKRTEQQHEIQQRNYRYVPRDPEVRHHYEMQRRQRHQRKYE